MAVTLLPPEGSTLAGDQLPVIPLSEVVDKVTGLSVSHSGPGLVKVGSVAVLTTMVIIKLFAHWPPSGVKVAVTSLPPDGSTLAGDQLPVIPLSEVVVKVIGLSFSHNGPGLVKVGSVAGVTTMVIMKLFAHWPASGVKVAVTSLPPDGSILAGDQLPVIPLLEVVGKLTGLSF